MAMKCSICQNPNKLDIDKDIMRIDNLSEIARKWGVGRDAVERHKRDGHISRQLVTAFKKQEAIQSLNMMSEFQQLMADIKLQIENFKQTKQHGLTLKATDTLIKLYQVMAQFASAYYQSQVQSSSLDREKIEYEINQEHEQHVKDSYSVLSDIELSILSAITMRTVCGDETYEVFPDHYSAEKLIERFETFLPFDKKLKINACTEIRRTKYPDISETKDLPVKAMKTAIPDEIPAQETEPEYIDLNNTVILEGYDAWKRRTGGVRGR